MILGVASNKCKVWFLSLKCFDNFPTAMLDGTAGLIKLSRV